MTTGSGILNDILLIWLPIAFAMLLTVLGLVRGVRREAVVSLSVVLAALILMVWGMSWATDLSEFIPSLSVADWQVTLGYLVMGLVVLAAGYGLASAIVARGIPTTASRFGGFLLGLANGTAIAGWLLRNHYIALRDSGAAGSAEAMDLLYRTPISFGLILWAGWFPIVVAVVAAVIAIVGPARRTRPTTLDEWTPASTTATAPPPALGAAAAPGVGAVAAPAVTAGAAYGAGTAVLPETHPAAYGSMATQGTVARTDAPPTMPMPGSEGRPLYSGGQETLNLGLTNGPAAPATPESTVPTRPASEQATVPQATVSTADEPSWLAAPMSTGRTDPRLDRQSPEQDSLVARSEAPTVEQSVQATSGSDLVTCSRCGSQEFRSAAFCTQCGNRLQAS